MKFGCTSGREVRIAMQGKDQGSRPDAGFATRTQARPDQQLASQIDSETAEACTRRSGY